MAIALAIQPVTKNDSSAEARKTTTATTTVTSARSAYANGRAPMAEKVAATGLRSPDIAAIGRYTPSSSTR